MECLIDDIKCRLTSRCFLNCQVSFPVHHNSPAEIQDDLAIASIENVFVYSDR